MTNLRNGHRFSIPASRRLSWDLLAFHQHVPLCAHDRRMNLTALSDARAECPQRISWPALFIRAYSLVAMDVPELRQTWYRWPWAHLYQHTGSVATLTVQRELDEEPWLFWGQIRHPETLSLSQIQEQITRYTTANPREVFERQLRLAHLPTIVRRLIWWWNLNVETKKRATRVGTFFLSTLASRGVEIQLPPSVQTGCLTYGPLDERGEARVTLAYDHRVMDGALVADILHRLERTLTESLVSELITIRTQASCGKAA